MVYRHRSIYRLLAVLFKDTLFGPRSVFTYILGNDWQHGLNIFALTASIMYACVALTVCAIVQALLRMLSMCLERAARRYVDFSRA